MDPYPLGAQIAILVALILANAVFALTEMAIVSSRKARLERQAEDGDIGAKAALELAEHPNQMLSTIQVGITLIGILTGTFGGASLSKALEVKLNSFPLMAPYSAALSMFVVVSLITYFSLIIGELVPKRIALNNPEVIAAKVARPMHLFSKIALPVVSFLSMSTGLVLRFLGIKPSKEPPVTEDEIRILLEQGTEAGAFEKTEQDIVDRVFRLADLRAYALMKPRTQMVWLDIEDSMEYNLNIISESQATRFPVAKGNLDDFIGVVHTNDLLSKVKSGESITLEECVKTPVFIPKSMKAFKVLELFKQSSVHEAVVLDEFGGVVGFITLHDILEELVGEMSLTDESDEPQIVEREDGSWLVDGLLAIDEFEETFGEDELPDEERDHYHTLGGFITSYLGHIPTVSEKFTSGNLEFEIVDMDRVRIDKVLVKKVKTE